MVHYTPDTKLFRDKEEDVFKHFPSLSWNGFIMPASKITMRTCFRCLGFFFWAKSAMASMIIVADSVGSLAICPVVGKNKDYMMMLLTTCLYNYRFCTIVRSSIKDSL